MWKPPVSVSVSRTPGGKLRPSSFSLNASSTAPIHSPKLRSDATSERFSIRVPSVFISNLRYHPLLPVVVTLVTTNFGYYTLRPERDARTGFHRRENERDFCDG